MILNSILLFIFLFIILINHSCCFWKNSKHTLENYIIDVFFTNSLTIIRCNPSERHILRDITIESIGNIKCSNWPSFLPDDQIEYITLLKWLYTTIECDKKKLKIKQEKTYFEIKHKSKKAFKKNPFKLIRVGSTDSSELYWKENDFQLYFKHPPRKLPINKTEQIDEDYSTEIYSFKNRPILCRARYFPYQQPCSNIHHENQNVSYICYYKIGVAEPPTVAEMEKEIKLLPHDINLDARSIVNLYMNKKAKKNSSQNFHFIIIIGICIVILIISGISIFCCCCCCQSDDDEKIQRINSNISAMSNLS